MHVELIRDEARTLPPIAAPNEVDTLRIWHCKYRTLDVLRQFTHLRGLEIATFPDSSLAPLSDLRNLRYLRLLHLPHVTDLEPLELLTSLTTLRLATLPSWDSSKRTTTVKSLTPLARLQHLRHLELLGIVPADESLSPLQECPYLETARFHLIRDSEVARFFAATRARDDFAPDPDF